MAFKEIYDVPENHQLTIHLPDNFPPKHKVVVTVAGIPRSKKAKLKLMKRAATVPRFIPFRPNTIHYEGKLISLKEKLECEVEFNDPFYYIKYKPLAISVWAESRDAAEEAFNFSFYALYENFAIEKDKNLSEKSIALKKQMKKIIKKVINEG